MEPTHASFFSGVGGLDLGLERAGWRTVSFSEIDPYANAVLAERWPEVPNLGDIVGLAEAQSVLDATLWSGGFPCQDLSVAGKRAGLAGARSGLAFAFLDLVERHRPPAILLENVPGLLSSHRGRDFAALLDRLGQLGYWWAYRILDARHFGVPQRRRRVFIVALNAERGFGPDSAAEVLSVGTRCGRHPATGHQAGAGTAERTDAGAVLARHGKGVGHNYPDDHLISDGHGSAADGATSTRTLGAAMGHHGYTMGAQDADGGYLQVGDHQSIARAVHASTGRRSGPAGDEVANLVHGASPNPGGVRAPDGLAGGVDDRERVVNALAPVGGGPDDNDAQAGHLVAFRKSARPTEADGIETWVDDGLANTLNAFDTGDIRSTHIALGSGPQDDPLLPLGLDSHRYRCCGNGVVSSVSEWIGVRLLTAIERAA